MGTNLSRLIRQRFPQYVIGTHAYRGQETLLIKREGLLEVAQFLRDDSAIACDVLMDLSCLDYLKFGKTQTSAPLLATPRLDSRQGEIRRLTR